MLPEMERSAYIICISASISITSSHVSFPNIIFTQSLQPEKPKTDLWLFNQSQDFFKHLVFHFVATDFLSLNYIKHWPIFEILWPSRCQEVCKKAIIKHPTILQMCRYTTLWNININVRKLACFCVLTHSNSQYRDVWRAEIAVLQKTYNFY